MKKDHIKQLLDKIGEKHKEYMWVMAIYSICGTSPIYSSWYHRLEDLMNEYDIDYSFSLWEQIKYKIAIWWIFNKPRRKNDYGGLSRTIYD